MKRVSNAELSAIDMSLGDRDREILKLLRRFRFMRTAQIQRLFFRKDATNRAQLSSTTRVLHRLERDGLIAHLDRQVRPNRGGTYGLVWHLTTVGVRLLDLGKTNPRRFRPYEPSQLFLQHTLAVVDTYVQICDYIRYEKDYMEIKDLEIESEAVREYDKDGRTKRIWPDLFIKLRNDRYTYYWYIEVDRGTEGMPEVLKKCWRYFEYYRTGRAQREYGVFPVVMWIVPDEARKNLMKRTIKKAFREYSVGHEFLIITPDELSTYLIRGAKNSELV